MKRNNPEIFKKIIKRFLPTFLFKQLVKSLDRALRVLALVNLCWLYLFHEQSPLIISARQDEYWPERLEKDYANIEAVENNPYYKKLFDELTKLIRYSDSGKTCLEAGCYFGYRANKIALEFPGKKITGIDLSRENIEFGFQTLDVARNLTLKQGDVTDLKYDDKAFDVVYTAVSLSHINYELINKAIKEISRVCKKQIIFLEVDFWCWGFKKKINTVNINYMYFHKYEKLNLVDFKLQKIVRFHFGEKYPRYSAFVFDRS